MFENLFGRNRILALEAQVSNLETAVRKLILHNLPKAKFKAGDEVEWTGIHLRVRFKGIIEREVFDFATVSRSYWIKTNGEGTHLVAEDLLRTSIPDAKYIVGTKVKWTDLSRRSYVGTVVSRNFHTVERTWFYYLEGKSKKSELVSEWQITPERPLPTKIRTKGKKK